MTSLHLFRNLIREARYFPDPVARQYMESHISQVFRVAKASNLNIAAARQALFLLRNANAGQVRCLERALFVAYGRIGQRRFMLLEPFFGSLSGSSKKEVRAPGLNYGPKLEAPKIWTVQPALLSLVQSQWKNRVVRALNVTQKITHPTPPMTSNMAPSLKYKDSKATVDRYYCAMLKRILPPLPQTEWDTLHGLIVKTEPWTQPRRRFQPRSLRNLDHNKDLAIPSGEALGLKQLVGGRPVKITRNLMTRLWENVIKITPRLVWLDEGMWRVFWGKPDVAVPIFRTIPPHSVKAIFGGVNQNNGRYLKGKKQHVGRLI